MPSLDDKKTLPKIHPEILEKYGHKGQPQDIKPNWLKVARSCQAQARKQDGHAVLTIHILVDANGNPQFWTTPHLTTLEPKASSVLDYMEANFTAETALAWLTFIARA